MSEKSSKFWIFALPVSLVILAGAYYIKIPAARQFIDAHTTLGHQLFGSFVHDTVVVETKPAATEDSDAPKTAARGGPVPNPKPVSTAPTPVPVFDLQELARDRAHWPKKVTLKKAANFPAVLNGKVVGSLTVPVGTEADLQTIGDGKVALVYQGGGAWVSVDDTDLASRVMGR